MTGEIAVVYRALLARLNGPMSEVLQPYAFASKVEDLTRGGFGSRSMPEGSRGAEPPLPVSQPVALRDEMGVPVAWSPVGPADAFDRQLQRAVREHHRLFQEMLRLADKAFVLEHSIMDASPPLTEVPCVTCARPLEDGRTKGECARCRQHRHRHGLEYPKVAATG